LHLSLSSVLREEEAWILIKPICRELYELINSGEVKFLDGSHNEKDGSYKIYLKCSKIHLASRGLFDKIGDIEYQNKKLRIGLRSNKIPLNIIIEVP
jgi:hypothetical protein